MVDSYRFGRIVVDGTAYENDILLCGGNVSSWWRRKGHSVCEEDLREVFDARPAVLVVGTGSVGMMRVPESVCRQLQGQGIEVHAEKSGGAVKLYNRYQQEGRDAALAVHLTC